MRISEKDTIAAISTALGEGGIGIIRMSGREALRNADKVFTPAKGGKVARFKTHSVHYGYLKNPKDGKVVDEAILTVMRGPNTYTREDIVEINCHGGVINIRKVLEICLESGARLADPGEFTKRAFLNGRIDLSQAEAVLDIIKSESDLARNIAVEHLKGSFSGEIRRLKEEVVNIITQIELIIDFGGEDVPFSSYDKITSDIQSVESDMRNILSTARRGMALRNGVMAVISGKPNVGKSSLMNAILRHDRVIVTPIAGTTRDIVEETVNIGGASVRLADTAGITDSPDHVESLGVKRSKERIASSQIILFVIDSSRPLDGLDMDTFMLIKDKKVIMVLNKTDLPEITSPKDAISRFGVRDIISVSALKGDGIENLEGKIAETILGGKLSISEGPIITNARHRDTLEKALEKIMKTRDAALKMYNLELLASDLNGALHDLGYILGESVDEDVLNSIFSKFCIGK